MSPSFYFSSTLLSSLPIDCSCSSQIQLIQCYKKPDYAIIEQAVINQLRIHLINTQAIQRKEEYYFLNMKTNATQTMPLPFQNHQQKCLSTSSQIIMDYEQEQSQNMYESAHVDELLQTSYVELENQEKTYREESLNFNSGQSFFQKTNQVFHSEMGYKYGKRMINKKLQCDIGSSIVEKQSDCTNKLDSKRRRLTMLKVIKLLRLVFKQVRYSHQQIKLQMLQEKKKNKEFLEVYATNMNSIHLKYSDLLGWKDMRIMELQLQIKRMSKLNESLNNQIEIHERVSQQMINQMQEEKIKSLAQIKQKSMSASLKVEQFQQENQTLEQQVTELQMELANLQETSNNQQVYIKKLQYENGQLDKENQSLLQKHEQIIQQYQENQQNYSEMSLQLCQANEEIRKLNKVNQLYQKELQSTKESVKRLQDINKQIVNQSQDIIFSELNRYQQQFNDELQKLKRQHNEQIFHKNTIIDNLKEFQEKYMAYLSREKNNNKKGILKKIDTNSSQNSITYQSQEIIPVPQSVSSESFINQSQNSQSASQIQSNLGNNKNEPTRRGQQRKTTFKKILIQKQKPARSQKMKMKSLIQCYEQKQSLIASKATDKKQFILKFKEKDPLFIRQLRQGTEGREGSIVSQNDKLSNKPQNKILNKQGLLSQRK